MRNYGRLILGLFDRNFRLLQATFRRDIGLFSRFLLRSCLRLMFFLYGCLVLEILRVFAFDRLVHDQGVFKRLPLSFILSNLIFQGGLCGILLIHRLTLRSILLKLQIKPPTNFFNQGLVWEHVDFRHFDRLLELPIFVGNHLGLCLYYEVVIPTLIDRPLLNLVWKHRTDHRWWIRWLG